jgi:hypothetical protein
MTSQEQTVVDTSRFLRESGVPYMVVGGLANAVWGEPRATLDVDITVWVADTAIPSFVESIPGQLQLLVDDPVDFIAQTRVLPLRSDIGVRVDMIFGLLPFEEEAIRRSVSIDIGGETVSFCTAEDLILMKIISDRERDLNDARGILARRFDRLDFGYLDPRISELARLTDRPEIQKTWAAWKDELAQK